MSPTVLVIDDEPPIRRLLRVGLATQGYAAAGGARRPHALALLGRERVDLVILDLGLPDRGGHDLLRDIRADHPDLPVVVLSSRGDEAGKVEALDLGADDYVTKPSAWANSWPACGRRSAISSPPRASARSSRSRASASTSCGASCGWTGRR